MKNFSAPAAMTGRDTVYAMLGKRVVSVALCALPLM